MGGKLSQGAVYSALAVLVIGCWFVLKPKLHSSEKVYRIGVNNSPPIFEIQADSTVGGFAVDVLNEAARRRNISLHWVPTKLIAEAALTSGLVDLWPVVGVTAERRKVIHLTEPWFFNTFCLIERQDDTPRTRGDVANKDISFTGFPLATVLANKYLPGARLVKKDSRAKVLEAMCVGEVAGAFEESSFVNTLMMNRPAACEGVPLKVNLIKDAVANGALASTGSAAAVADELRSEISKLAADGTMAASMERWVWFSANETRSVLVMQEAGRQRQVLMYCLLLALLASVSLFWQARKAASARKAAERASAVKSEFLANMSHEIRTPLNGVLGLLNIVLDGEVTPSERQHIETARQSGESLLAVLNDILDLAAVEAGALRIAKAEFNLQRTLNDLVELFGPKCNAKQLTLTLKYPDSIPTVFHGDQNRVRQIAGNFVGNAVKFTNRGTIEISVLASPEGRRNSWYASPWKTQG